MIDNQTEFFIKQFYPYNHVENLIIDPLLLGEHSILKQLQDMGLFIYKQSVIQSDYSDVPPVITFINDNSMNAIAALNGMTPIICMNIGCLMTLQNNALLLTMCRDFLGNVGDIQECLSIVHSDDYEPPDIKKKENGTYEINFYTGSYDATRQELAAFISIFAHSFLMFHEIGHHLYGHTRYLNRLGFPFLEMSKRKSNSSLDNLTIQCLETHADAYAAYQLSDVIINASDTLFTELPWNEDERYRTIFEVFIISISLVFLAMDDDGIDEMNYTRANYLPQRLRLELIISSVKKALAKNTKNKFASFCVQNINFYETIPIIYNSLRKRYNQIHELSENHDELFFQSKELDRYYQENILRTWSTLERKVSSFALIKASIPKEVL